MQSPGEYEIVKCNIISHTIDDTVDVGANVVELIIHESIMLPYLTAYLTITDDFAMYDKLRINGTEIIELTIQQPQTRANYVAYPVTLRFNIKEVLAAKKTSDDREVIELHLLETTYVNQAANLISKAYKGRPDRIIQQILKDGLGMDINLDLKDYIAPIQEPMHICIPYMTAFDACNMILQRISTDLGLPFYLFTTLNTGIIQLQSLEQMVKSNIWNDHAPYRFSQAFNEGSEHISDPNIVFNVLAYSALKNENTIGLMERGCVGSGSVNIDVVAGSTLNYQMNIDNVFNDLVDSKVIPLGHDPIHHSAFTVNDKKISDLNSKQITTIMSAKSIQGFNNISESHTPAQFKNRHAQHSMRSMLIKSKMTIVVPGKLYLTGHHASIGRQISYVHHSNDSRIKDIGGNVSTEDVQDKSRSGIYTILGTKHMFTSDKKHNVILDCGKLGRPR